MNALTAAGAKKTPASATDPRAGKYLTFQLGAEEFGVRVLQVREIVGIQEITGVPHTPRYVKGVINLRGRVIPVLDLRLRIGFPETEYTQRTCIIVVQVAGMTGGSTPTGLLVDAVLEVVALTGAEIEDVPDFGVELPASCLLGLAKHQGKVRILLDIEQVLSAGDLQKLGKALAGHGT
jgi:purine-binding chemotaxis protein CheW